MKDICAFVQNPTGPTMHIAFVEFSRALKTTDGLSKFSSAPPATTDPSRGMKMGARCPYQRMSNRLITSIQANFQIRPIMGAGALLLPQFVHQKWSSFGAFKYLYRYFQGKLVAMKIRGRAMLIRMMNQSASHDVTVWACKGMNAHKSSLSGNEKAAGGNDA